VSTQAAGDGRGRLKHWVQATAILGGVGFGTHKATLYLVCMSRSSHYG
jgi:hypothetical protein